MRSFINQSLVQINMINSFKQFSNVSILTQTCENFAFTISQYGFENSSIYSFAASRLFGFLSILRGSFLSRSSFLHNRGRGFVGWFYYGSRFLNLRCFFYHRSSFFHHGSSFFHNGSSFFHHWSSFFYNRSSFFNYGGSFLHNGSSFFHSWRSFFDLSGCGGGRLDDGGLVHCGSVVGWDGVVGRGSVINGSSCMVDGSSWSWCVVGCWSWGVRVLCFSGVSNVSYITLHSGCIRDSLSSSIRKSHLIRTSRYRTVSVFVCREVDEA